MRPPLLVPLFASATSLPGIGPRMQLLLKKALRLPPVVTEARVIDLLWHTPAGVIDRRATPTVAAAVPGTIATLRVRVLKHRPSPRGNSRAPYKVGCEDETGRLDLVFFHADPRFIQRQLPEGSLRYVSGRVDIFNDRKQMSHPDYIVPPEARADLPMLEPVYPLTAGLSGKVLLKAVRGALELVPELPEWQDPAWLKGRGWPDLKGALTRLHHARRAGGRLGRLGALAAARLRRAAGRAAGAGPGAAELQAAGRAQRRGRRPHPRQDRRCAPLQPHQLAAPGAEGDRAGHLGAVPHAAAAAGRRGLGQDRGGADGHGHRRGGRRPGRPDGAHRGAGAPARRDHRAARRSRGAPHRAADGPREGQGARRAAGAAEGRRDRHPDRHARAVPVRRGVQGPGLRRHRRAAPLRRAPAPRPADEGRPRGRQSAGHDRHADPAHAAHDPLRRPRRVAPHREAGRAQADRHQDGRGGVHRAADRAPQGAARARARRSTGCAR